MGKVFHLTWELNLALPCFGVSALHSCILHILQQVTQPAGLASLNHCTVRQWKVRFNLTEVASPPSLFPSSCIIYLWWDHTLELVQYLNLWRLMESTNYLNLTDFSKTAFWPCTMSAKRENRCKSFQLFDHAPCARDAKRHLFGHAPCARNAKKGANVPSLTHCILHLIYLTYYIHTYTVVS